MSHPIVTPEQHASVIKNEGIKSGTWDLRADVVVIGSGAGGAVAAAQLAAAGWKTVLVEEGSYFHGGHFHSDEYRSLARMYRDGGFIISEEQSISIVQGRTLGGSTTVNWQTSLYPPDYVGAEWEERFGLKGYTRKAMDPYVSAVHKRLNVQPAQLRNKNNAVLWDGALKLGLTPEVIPNNNRNCIGLGRCGLGCPINAKQSMFLTYIPDALQHNARVITNMRAERIEDGEMKTVHCTFTPDPYARSPKNRIEKLTVRAPVVVLSAGAIEGPALLQRSNLGNDWVGQDLKVHPTVTIMARFKNEINMFKGPPQSVVLKHGHNQDNTGYGYWLETAPYRPSLAAAVIPFYGKEHFEQMRNYKHLQAGLVLVRDGADGQTNGRVEWSGGKRKVHYSLTKTDARNLLRGLKSLAEIQVAAGATELIFPFGRLDRPHKVKPGESFDWVLKENIASGRLALGSAHPHGSIRAAVDAKQGAVDANLELHGHKNIYVMDASVFPTGLSVNPQITTMSTSLRAALALVARGKPKT